MLRFAAAQAEILAGRLGLLAGQPTMDQVLPRFHAFCGDTVLVVRNAAFDLRFPQLMEEATAIRFAQPVLDTMLLSPVIHPNQESHRLEAIAGRLGVQVECALPATPPDGTVASLAAGWIGAAGAQSTVEARRAASR